MYRLQADFNAHDPRPRGLTSTTPVTETLRISHSPTKRHVADREGARLYPKGSPRQEEAPKSQIRSLCSIIGHPLLKVGGLSLFDHHLNRFTGFVPISNLHCRTEQPHFDRWGVCKVLRIQMSCQWVSIVVPQTCSFLKVSRVAKSRSYSWLEFGSRPTIGGLSKYIKVGHGHVLTHRIHVCHIW